MGFSVSKAIKKATGAAVKVATAPVTTTAKIVANPTTALNPVRAADVVRSGVSTAAKDTRRAAALGFNVQKRVVRESLKPLNPRTGAEALESLTPGHAAGSNSWLAGMSPVSVSRNVHEAAKHFGGALTGREPLKAGLYKANYHFTRAHPGADATRAVVQEKWGVPVQENTSKIAAGAGAVFGGIYGPIGGVIAGGATGWGIGAQFGDEDGEKAAYRAAFQGAASGLVAGRVSTAFRGGFASGAKETVGAVAAGRKVAALSSGVDAMARARNGAGVVIAREEQAATAPAPAPSLLPLLVPILMML